MAQLVGVAGLTHNPLMWRTLQEGEPDDLKETARHLREFRSRVVDLKPDVLVVVASDHLHMLLTSNMPAFLVGKAPLMRAVHPNEERMFGLARATVPGAPDLARHLLDTPSDSAPLDFAFSDEPWLDHSFVVPLLCLTPELDIPVVPVFTNANSPPIPSARRFAELGTVLRAAIDSAPSRARVLLVGSGHLAHELGGPRQFLGRSPDDDFDADAVRWMAEGDLEAAIAGCSFDRLFAAGNETFQFLNFLACLSASGPRPATVAAGPETRFSALPFFWWEMG